MNCSEIMITGHYKQNTRAEKKNEVVKSGWVMGGVEYMNGR